MQLMPSIAQGEGAQQFIVDDLAVAAAGDDVIAAQALGFLGRLQAENDRQELAAAAIHGNRFRVVARGRECTHEPAEHRLRKIVGFEPAAIHVDRGVPVACLLERGAKQELTEYFTELTQTEMKEYFRGNLWTNTPDILPFHLQEGGPPVFRIRAILAATLSSLYGIYSGFELCENAPLPGREEYLDSEKYQWKERDWNAPGNIKPLITRLNRIRRQNRALQFYDNLRFYPAENDSILFYGKTTPARDNIIFVAVNLDPNHMQYCFVTIPLEDFGLDETEEYQMHDLLTDARYIWRGPRNYIELNPHLEQAAHIFRLRRSVGGGRFA